MSSLGIAAGLFAAGALAGPALRRSPAAARRASCLLAIFASLAASAEALHCLLGGAPAALRLPGPGGLAAFSFSLSPLGALFCLLISAVSILTSVYALDYAEEYDGKAGSLGFFYNLFLLGMVLVPAADNAFSFLFAWEWMTLTSFFLVVLEHEDPNHRSAGFLYFVMSQAGTAMILAAFLILARAAGSLDFSALRSAAQDAAPWARNAVFLLALGGFGLKAGVVPLHLWLPYAHPAAPSHVSSLMSGVMIKTGIYGLLLVTVDLLGGGPSWWGGLVLGLAAVSAVLGVLYALMEHDLKRLLAYHSVENIGIILMGVGAGLLFQAQGRRQLAALAFAAGLYHTVNHATFKSLLFLGAGSVIKATRTRDIEKLGGLLRSMPVTGSCFLVGSLAICAIPPFNGFMSEWLTFQSLLGGFGTGSMVSRIALAGTAAALALTGGLAAACFVKAFGVSFLALPRSDAAREAREAGVFERFSMVALAAACLLLGLFPGPLLRVLEGCLGAGPAQGATLAAGGSAAILQPALLLALLALAGLFTWALAASLSAGAPPPRRSPTWACGLPAISPRMEYTSTAFSKPLRLAFAFIYRPVREVRREHAETRYFPTEIAYSSEITHWIKERLYHPPIAALLRAAHAIRRLQAGSVNLYLGYLSAAIAALLLLQVWRARP